MEKQNRIQLVKSIVQKLNDGTYQEAAQVAQAIDHVIMSFWESGKLLSNLDLYEQDLGEFCDFHSDLIEKLIGVLQAEVSGKNTNALQNHTNFRDCLGNIESGKPGHQIYLFNEVCDYYFIGDLHSDDSSLKRSLAVINFYQRVFNGEKFRVIFTGDYVDRGHVHLKILERIMLLKILFPDYVYLLRGNHDGGILNDDQTLTTPYMIPERDTLDMYFPAYLQLLMAHNPTVDDQLLVSYLQFFDHLPYFSVQKIADRIVLAVHGGIPRPNLTEETYFGYLVNLAELTNPNLIDEGGFNILSQIMWSDPQREEEDLRVGAKRFKFTEEHFDAFCHQFGVDLLIRGHQTAQAGFRYQFHDRLITVFSSGGQHVKGDRLVAENWESAYQDITPRALWIDKKGNHKFL